MGVRWRGVLSSGILSRPPEPSRTALSVSQQEKVGLVSRGVSVPAPGGVGGETPDVFLCPVAPGMEARCEDHHFLPWLPSVIFSPHS